MNPFDFRYLGKAGEYIKEFWGGETSIAQVMECMMCNSAGKYDNADFISTHCESCSGRGKILASYSLIDWLL